MKFFIQAGALFGALAVSLGAFGAHALKASLEASNRLDTFETAVKYQFYHAIALVVIGALLRGMTDADAVKWLNWSGYSFIGGVLIFCGSLYAICFTGITKFGATAPIGGLLMVLGWVFLLIVAGKLTW